MGIFGKPVGIFDLNDSDKMVGSFISQENINILLADFYNCDKSGLKFNKLGFIDEIKVLKLWNKNKIISAQERRKRSFDEIILAKLIRYTYPKAKIEPQVNWYSDRRKQVDFIVTIDKKKIVIEFDGPQHYAHINKMWKEPENPLIRKSRIENEFQIECVLWPFWIQRCKQNVKAIFDDNEKGLGALWSTNVLFGDFFFDDSSQIIRTITDRFKAADSYGIGYFYSLNSKNRQKPEHPIISLILEKKETINRILPKGFDNSDYWIPEKLK